VALAAVGLSHAPESGLHANELNDVRDGATMWSREVADQRGPHYRGGGYLLLVVVGAVQLTWLLLLGYAALRLFA
jgi:hypothetical protein